MNKKRILLVDDAANITRSVKLNLERTGDYEVLVENHALNGVAAAKAFKPDLIFLDVMMPDLDGGGLAALILAEPELMGVPIIFMTAIVSRQETGGAVFTSGGKKFLAKPVSLPALVACIEDHTLVAV